MNNVKSDGESFLPISLNDDFQDSNDNPENQRNVSTINNSLKNSILERNLEVVQISLQNGANPNIQFWARKITALQLAIAVGSLEIIQNLLIRGADVNMADSRGITPLHLAAENGMIELVPCLINAGAKVNIQDLSGQTPLHRAATGDHLKVLEYLVSYGAHVNSLNARGLSPLQFAVDMGHLNSVEFLLQNGADILVHTEGDTLLHICSQKGHASILELLLAKPEMLDNINSVNSKGHVPLHEAALRRTSECIQLLLKAGADLGAKTIKGSSATTLILESPNGTKILSKRLDDSINTNGIDPSDKTCEIVFDFSVFLSKDSKQQMGVIKDVLDDPRKQLITDLIEHPLTELFLCLKWEKIRYFFLVNLIFYIIFMIQMTNYVSNVVSSDWINVTVFVNSQNATDSNATETNQTLNFIVKPVTNMLDWLALTLLLVFIIFLEIAEFATLKSRYFKRFESWMKISVIITSMIVLCSDTPWPDWVHRVSAATILLGWFQVNFLLGRLPTFGVYVLVFYSVAKNLMKFIGAYVFFLIGFSSTFYLIFTKHHEGPYDSPWTSPLRTLALMLGDHDYDKYMAEGKHNLGPMANVIYFFFLLLVSLILMNLLIGLAVNDIQELQKQSRVERLRKQAEFIIFFEKICTPRILSDSSIINAAESIYPWTWVQKTQRLILSWITISSKLSVNPTKKEFCYFKRNGVSSDVLDRSLVILKSKQATENSAVNHDMYYNLLKECMASIESLRKQMGNLKYQ